MPKHQRNIQKLDEHVTAVLKSQVVINSLADAVKEVIQNSEYLSLCILHITNNVDRF